MNSIKSDASMPDNSFKTTLTMKDILENNTNNSDLVEIDFIEKSDSFMNNSNINLSDTSSDSNCNETNTGTNSGLDKLVNRADSETKSTDETLKSEENKRQVKTILKNNKPDNIEADRSESKQCRSNCQSLCEGESFNTTYSSKNLIFFVTYHPNSGPDKSRLSKILDNFLFQVQDFIKNYTGCFLKIGNINFNSIFLVKKTQL